MNFDVIVVGVGGMRGNQAKCLLLTTAEGHPELVNAGGLASIGLADHAITIWWGLIAPNGVPEDRMERLRTAFLDAARSTRFRELVEGQGPTYRLDAGPAMAAAVRA